MLFNVVFWVAMAVFLIGFVTLLRADAIKDNDDMREAMDRMIVVTGVSWGMTAGLMLAMLALFIYLNSIGVDNHVFRLLF